MSFVVTQTLYDGNVYYGPPRYYDLQDGSLSMEVVRTHNGTRIYSAEKLLVDIEKHLDRVPGGKRIVITPALALEESIE